MANTHQQARLLQATAHKWPDVHAEAMHYRKEFGRAWGMLECLADTIEDSELPEAVRRKVMAFQMARVRKALSEWKV